MSEIAIGYCHCGCGKETAVSKYTDSTEGRVKGQPVKYVRGHNSAILSSAVDYNEIDPPNPDGFCMCGCGEKTPIALKNRIGREHLAGHHTKYVSGHARRNSGPNYKEEDRGHETVCWIWQKATSKGYGIIAINNKPCRAHRIYYYKKYGNIPKDKVLDHLCREPSCVNPEHLEPVTQAENMYRGKLFNDL